MNKHILLTGASGFVGANLALCLARAGHKVVAAGGKNFCPEIVKSSCVATVQLDLSSQQAIAAALVGFEFQSVIHAAALANTNACERDPKLAKETNVNGCKNLISFLESRNQTERPQFIYLSTDMVFDGNQKSAPVGGFTESAEIMPNSVYALTKAEAEQTVLNSRLPAIVLRTALVMGQKIEELWGFMSWTTQGLKAGSASLFKDEFRTPVHVQDIARVIDKLCESPNLALSRVKAGDNQAILHIAGPERVSRVELGIIVAKHLGLNQNSITPTLRAELPSPISRPYDLSLSTNKLRTNLGIVPMGIDECVRLSVTQ